MPGRSGLVLLMLLTTSSSELDHNESFPPRRGLSPAEVARCLSGSLQVGCDAFVCLENSSCDTDGMHHICRAFLFSAAMFDTQGKVFVKESLKCIANGITARALPSGRSCSSFHRMMSQVQDQCYRKLRLCSVAHGNADAIAEVAQPPRHFPNRFYGGLLRSLLECEEDTVERVRSSMVTRLGPEMAALMQLLQSTCPSSGGAGPAAAAAEAGTQGGWRWAAPPRLYKSQPGLRDRDAAGRHVSRKRSDSEGS